MWLKSFYQVESGMCVHLWHRLDCIIGRVHWLLFFHIRKQLEVMGFLTSQSLTNGAALHQGIYVVLGWVPLSLTLFGANLGPRKALASSLGTTNLFVAFLAWNQEPLESAISVSMWVYRSLNFTRWNLYCYFCFALLLLPFLGSAMFTNLKSKCRKPFYWKKLNWIYVIYFYMTMIFPNAWWWLMKQTVCIREETWWTNYSRIDWMGCGIFVGGRTGFLIE